MIQPVGPIDPTVGVMSVQAVDGKPLAVVGNYSLHYVGGVGEGHVSADYFAYWAAEMTRRAGGGDPRFIAMLTNGAQGDINNIDVMKGRSERLLLCPYDRSSQDPGGRIRSHTKADLVLRQHNFGS
ncbi:MAG: hypothetical protein WKF37_05105 [Bryobacteraceae bacterium]